MTSDVDSCHDAIRGRVSCTSPTSLRTEQMTILVRVAAITILALACTACTSEQLQRFSEGVRKSQNGDPGNAFPGYRDAQQQQAQTQLMKAHTEAMQQWTQCMQTVRDANQLWPRTGSA